MQEYRVCENLYARIFYAVGLQRVNYYLQRSTLDFWIPLWPLDESFLRFLAFFCEKALLGQCVPNPEKKGNY